VENKNIKKSIFKLYEKIKASPYNVRFEDVCTLAEGVGFIRKIIKGRTKSGTSHNFKYFHIGIKEVLNFQNKKGQAVPYQVRQLLNIIDNYDLLKE